MVGETLIVDPLMFPGLQVILLPPGMDGVAVNVAAVPSQIVTSLTVKVGIGFTVMGTITLCVHPFKLEVTVYVVLTVGFAITVAPVVLFSPVAGTHV